MTIRVAVLGASGRMGSTVCQAVEDTDGLELVARLDVGDHVDDAHLGGAQVAVDFTVPEAAEANVHALIDAGLDVVVGTTGWTEESYSRVRDHLDQANVGLDDGDGVLPAPAPGGSGSARSVLIAPNFALSAVLAMSFAAKAARYFESAEIIELHHPAKADAPSGTAVATARGIAAARADAGLGPVPDATRSETEGARGAVIDGIHVHAVRLRGLTAHEEVLLGNPGEQLTIRTDSFDRNSFMPGVILAVREVSARPGLTIGLDALLDL